MEPTPAPGLVTFSITMSVDGFVAGPRQSLDNPIGEGGGRLHRWMFEQPDANAPEIAAPDVSWRLHHGPQHVRSRARRVGYGLARLVGRGAALPRASVRPHPSRARPADDAGRDSVLLHHRRN